MIRLDARIAAQEPAGGRFVGWLRDAPAPLRFYVRSVRAWSAGPEAQAEVWSRFSTALGARDGRFALRAFETALLRLRAHGLRKLCGRPLTCARLCADEATIAALLDASAGLRIPEAAALAQRLVKPEGVAPLVEAGMGLAPYADRLVTPAAAGPRAAMDRRMLH
ncbi:MAG: hypothetical protein AAFR16_03740 [Pseudomonadota bacterium]